MGINQICFCLLFFPHSFHMHIQQIKVYFLCTFIFILLFPTCTYCPTYKCFPTPVHIVQHKSVLPHLCTLSYIQVFPHTCAHCPTYKCVATSVHIVLHTSVLPHLCTSSCIQVCCHTCAQCPTYKCVPTPIHTVRHGSVSPHLYILSYRQVFPHTCPYCPTDKCFPTPVHTVLQTSAALPNTGSCIPTSGRRQLSDSDRL